MNNFIKLLDKNKKNVVISSNAIFEALFKSTLNTNYLYDITFKTFPDLVHDLLGGFTNSADYELSKKLNISFDGSGEYLDFLMLIGYTPEKDEKEIDILKEKCPFDLSFVDDIKEYYVEPLGSDDYINTNIIIVKHSKINLLELKALRMLKEINNSINYLKFDNKELLNHTLTEYNTTISEVEDTCEKISKLIYDGVKIDNIKIQITDEAYKKIIDDVFPFYNLEYYYNENKKLSEFEDVLSFFYYVLNERYKGNENLDFNTETLDEYIELRKDNRPLNNECIRSLREVLSGYESMPADYFLYSISTISSKTKRYEGAIEITNNIMDSVIRDDEHIFILGVSESKFPKPIMYSGLITDEILKITNSPTELEYNAWLEEYYLDKIKTITNLYISYALKDESHFYIKASILDRIESLKIMNPTNNKIRFSKKRDIVRFLKAEDLYIKYGSMTDDYKNFYSVSKDSSINRMNFNTTFEIENKNSVKNFLDKKINISYSHLSTYFKCPFRYFLEHILKLNPYKTNYDGYLGTFFHEVMEHFFDKEYDQAEVDLLYEKYKKEQEEKNNFVLSPDQEYFFNKFYNHLEEIVNTIKHNFRNYKIDNIKKEDKFYFHTLSNDIDITIKGSIDLVITDNNDNLTIVDYKTGKHEAINLDNKKGLQMLIYAIYYNKKNKDIYKPFAFLYQVIDKRLENAPYVKSSGAYLNDENKISYIDPDGSVLPTRGNKYNKEELDKLLKDTEDIVSETIDKITSFEINATPSIDSCSYCPYQDMCYKKDIASQNDEEEVNADEAN